MKRIKESVFLSVTCPRSASQRKKQGEYSRRGKTVLTAGNVFEEGGREEREERAADALS